MHLVEPEMSEPVLTHFRELGRTVVHGTEIDDLGLSDEQWLTVIQAFDDHEATVGGMLVLDKEWLATLIIKVLYQNPVCQGIHCPACAVHQILYRSSDPAVYECQHTADPTIPISILEHLTDQERHWYETGIIAPDVMARILAQYYFDAGMDLAPKECHGVAQILLAMGVTVTVSGPIGACWCLPALCPSIQPQNPEIMPLLSLSLTVASPVIGLGRHVFAGIMRLCHYVRPYDDANSERSGVTPQGYCAYFYLGPCRVQVVCQNGTTARIQLYCSGPTLPESVVETVMNASDVCRETLALVKHRPVVVLL